MIERGYGRIVNVSSVTGPVVANPEEAVYCAAKAGVLGMTRGVALDVAKHGITVNAVGPGLDQHGLDDKRASASRRREHAFRARGDAPAEVGKLICFLGSRRRQLHHRANSLVIDGGNTIQEYKGPSELYY